MVISDNKCNMLIVLSEHNRVGESELGRENKKSEELRPVGHVHFLLLSHKEIRYGPLQFGMEIKIIWRIQNCFPMHYYGLVD